MGTRYTRRQIQEAIAYWKRLLEADGKTNSPRSLDEGKISDFFGRLFRTKKFIAAQDKLLKQKNYKEHPLMEVADKMKRSPFYVRFTNADMENDGYPQTFSHKYDCIAVKLDRGGNDRYDKLEDREGDIMALARKCGLPEGYGFCKVDDDMGVIVPSGVANWNVVELDESDKEFEEIDDIVAFFDGKDVKWKKATKTKPVNAVQAKGGEKVKTVGSDGNEETSRTAKEGDWIVNNVGNPDNKWIIDGGTFSRKYKADEKKKGQYIPWDGKKNAPPPPMLAAKVSDVVEGGKGVKFAPPNWGGDVIQIKNDGWFMKDPNNEKDIYAISKPDFESSYELK